MISSTRVLLPFEFSQSVKDAAFVFSGKGRVAFADLKTELNLKTTSLWDRLKLLFHRKISLSHEEQMLKKSVEELTNQLDDRIQFYQKEWFYADFKEGSDFKATHDANVGNWEKANKDLQTLKNDLKGTRLDKSCHLSKKVQRTSEKIEAVMTGFNYFDHEAVDKRYEALFKEVLEIKENLTYDVNMMTDVLGLDLCDRLLQLYQKTARIKSWYKSLSKDDEHEVILDKLSCLEGGISDNLKCIVQVKRSNVVSSLTRKNKNLLAKTTLSQEELWECQRLRMLYRFFIEPKANQLSQKKSLADQMTKLESKMTTSTIADEKNSVSS